MNKIEGWIKDHPYMTGGIALIAFILFYVLTKGGSSPAQSGSDAVANNALSASLQEQQIQAQSNAANSQVAASEYQTQAEAQVAEQQASAQVSAQNESTDAALVAALAQNQTTAAANTDEENIQDSTLSTELAATTNTNNDELASVENTNTTNLSAYNDNLTAQTTLAQLQAGLYGSALTDQTQLQEIGMNDQQGIDSSIVSEVGAAGLNHGTASLENSLTGILGEVTGNTGIGVAAENANFGAAAAQENSTSSILNSIGSLGKTVVSAL